MTAPHPVLSPGLRRRACTLGWVAIATLVSACATNPDPGPDGSGAGGQGSSGDGVGGFVATGGGTHTGGMITGPTTEVTASEVVPNELRQKVSAASELDGPGILASYPTTPTMAVDYDARAAAGMDLLQASSLALNESELNVLAEQGLVISTRQQFPSFAYGYKSIYGSDLPLYVSADSILEAVHRAFDRLLQGTEEQVLIPELKTLLTNMRAGLASTLADEATRKDADTYLTVAQSLLEGTLLSPSATADPNEIGSFFELASAASGEALVSLFGVERQEDYSQFEPRGHYTGSPELQAYFKAMMWLGRVDFRIVETLGTGEQVFRRRQFDAAAGMYFLLQGELERFGIIDQTIGAFVGEHDSMTPPQMGGLLEALGASTPAEVAALDDQAIVAEMAAGGWGAQRIASRLIENAPGLEKLPLDRSFAIFGQRYTVDSHTFSNTTFDRVPDRLLPSPLDAAFAALGNNAALPLLAPEFSNVEYVQALATTRTLVDAHEDAYWEGSVYTRWLGALRTLSTLPEGSTTPRTLGWDARMLSTQLGSWAEARHDTLLYAKQSYTSGVTCEFPDAYVDPYPEFYARIGELAEGVRAVMNALPSSGDVVRQAADRWATDLQTVAANLQTMAENQLSGAEHSQELIDFINDAVNWDEEGGCGGPSYSNFAGWYLRLHLFPDYALEYDPVVADVHTDGYYMRVLHVGVGMPRLMVVTANTCTGPRAYVGLAFSYGEEVTENLERLTDEEWATAVELNPFPDVPWMGPVLAE